MGSNRHAVLVPVKAFATAKLRLATALGPEERSELARRMAAHVVAATNPLPVHVVCDNVGVATWARQCGAQVMWAPGRGLNGAVAYGVECLADAGFDRVLVAHSDLPLASDLAALVPGNGVTIAPDRHDDGTNVIVVPSRVGFTFSYGPGSFRRHLAEAVRLGLATDVVRSPGLAWDVDEPSDLCFPDGVGAFLACT